MKINIESNSLIIRVSEDDSVPSIYYIVKQTVTYWAKQSRYFSILNILEELKLESKYCNKNTIKLKKERSSICLTFYLQMIFVDKVHLTIQQEQIVSKKDISNLYLLLMNLKEKLRCF